MKVRPISSDDRYTVTKEHTGATYERFVVRFCGELVGSFGSYPDAVLCAGCESARQRGALIFIAKEKGDK